MHDHSRCRTLAPLPHEARRPGFPTKTSFDGTKLPVVVRPGRTTTPSMKLLLPGQSTGQNGAQKRVDIGVDAGNVHLDSLGEAGERPALPRNCKMSFVILVESGDRANRWSRKNLRGRGRLQDAFRRSAGTYPRGDSSLLATSIFNPRSLGRATWKTKTNRICCTTRPSRGRGVISRRSVRRSPLMWGSLG